MLRTLASDQELALLEASLRWIEKASLTAFTQLFEPGRARKLVPAVPPAVAAPLVAFEVAERVDGALRGVRRVRRVGGRFYVMELGLGNDYEYLQDVWPETDALLAALEDAPHGRLLDLGTGCGVVAVEAAARGHQVVATDLYEPTVVLARFNARLNRLDSRIDFRQGHLFEPVAGERFDLILTNPHYGHSDDQLRLEVLRGAPAQLAPSGKMLLATALEWDEAATPRALGVTCALEPLVAAGFDVKVSPLDSTYKRDWFTVARGAPGLVSRHRFTIEVAPSSSPRLQVEWPKQPLTEEIVPLARLTRAGRATCATADDVARLDDLLEKLAASQEITFDAPLPIGVIDDCRWGRGACVGERSAAGAIVDPSGAVRPCTHGPALVTAGDSLASLTARLEILAAEARARRGCDQCPADATCSHCLFPVAVDEASYCALVTKRQAQLPLLLTLFTISERLEQLGVPAGPLALQRLDDDDWRLSRGGRRFVYAGAELRET